MLSVIGSIFGWASGSAIFLAGLAAYYYYTRRSVGLPAVDGEMNAPTRRHLDMLERSNWRAIYAAIIGRALDWLDARLSPNTQDYDSRGADKFVQAAFSHDLFKFCLFSSFSTVILSLTTQAAMTNTDILINMDIVFSKLDRTLKSYEYLSIYFLFLIFTLIFYRRNTESSLLVFLIFFPFYFH